MGVWQKILEKLNPVQRSIAEDQGEQGSTQTKSMTIDRAYENIEVVNRCVNLIANNAALVDFTVGETLSFTGKVTSVRHKKINELLNKRPNPYMDISTFRRLSLFDFLVDGNTFWYFDGTSLYHLPARNVTIVPDENAYVAYYRYEGLTNEEFFPNEIIHIRDNSTTSLYRGDSRITSSLQSLYTRETMVDFQDSFFKNGTAMGMIIETEQILNTRMKERQEKEWLKKYNPKRGNGRPIILDGGMKAKQVTNPNFREMMFNDSISDKEKKVCVALGIPPILLDSGNNANLKPNLELWFYTEVLPMLRKFESAVEFFFAYDIELTTLRVPALLPDQKAEADRYSTLVNNGLMTGNEAREKMRLEKLDDPEMDKIRIPQNIAGSGTGVSGQEGGRPENEDD
jgi:HK97 family phage portal protein